MGVELTLFTVDEANRLATELRPELTRIRELKAEYERLERRAAVLELAVAGTDPANPDAIELQNLQLHRRSLGERIGRGIRAVQTRGCLVKDLDRGLVDFYSLSGDRLIFLCWQLSEAEVSHWHTLDGGFGGRQPLHRSETE